MPKKIFTVESPLGYTVSCTNESWDHIVTHGHEVMENNVDAMIEAIGDPVYVYKSAEHPKSRDVFFGKSTVATYGESYYTKVIVEKPNEYNNEGEIVSAWPQPTISGGIEEGGLQYVKRKPRQQTRYSVSKD